MLTERDVLKKLDGYMEFIDLNHPYVYLIDCRLNVFRDDNDKWAIVSERLGYDPRGDSISLELGGFGNCLLQQEHCVSPIDRESFWETIDIESLLPDAKYWLVRGIKVELSHNKQDYINAGIQLKELEPNDISAEEVARLIIIKHRNLFRATDEELHQLVPKELQKVLVLDEWHHRHYKQVYERHISQEQIDITYAVGKHMAGGKEYMDFETFIALYREKEERIYKESLQKWKETKPGSYETWQQIAKVIVTGDASFYKPTLAPNTHWIFWPESGSM